ncbi:hypothetical protein ACGFZK_05910 [Streptomyces sp. NPDC048257]|uniref:hypothetical protein n=1 Tax=Streptomyces sp. NPDC048257 TaxID=3365526 RepID=UPI00371E793D
MSLSSRIVMPGQIRSVAAQDPSGPLYVTRYGSSPLETVVTMVDVSGAAHWERAYAGTGRPRSRLSADGTLWLACPGDEGGRTLEGILPDGSMGRTVLLPCDTGEEVAAFVVLDDGFCISWAGASRMLLEAGHQPSLTPRVARYTMEGHCRWSTPISLGTVSHPGVMGMSAETDWEIRPVKPWAPKRVEAAYSEPLLVSGDRVAASFTDERSGIGRTFFLDLASGTAVGTTNPAPSGRKAISGPGEFLIGAQVAVLEHADDPSTRTAAEGREPLRGEAGTPLLLRQRADQLQKLTATRFGEAYRIRHRARRPLRGRGIQRRQVVRDRTPSEDEQIDRVETQRGRKPSEQPLAGALPREHRPDLVCGRPGAVGQLLGAELSVVRQPRQHRAESRVLQHARSLRAVP